MSEDRTADASQHIEIPGDSLIPDAEFCDQVLAGATRRTGGRLDAEGLPYVIIAGRKYRPLNEGRAWLANRIVRKSQLPPRRRSRNP
jgi:hypothetical protein